MVPEPHPLVTIGVPVYNGESGLSRSLASLLRQDYPNLEIIISDNGSTDATQSICEEYALADPRVRYSRSDQNMGPVWNFNRLVHLSSGEYFMWAAHDDECAPSFVSACVEQLQRHPDAVLCAVYTTVSIEGRDETLCVFRLDSFDNVTGVTERYRETLKHFPAPAIYGVYRAAAMRKTRLFQNVIGSDLAFILELSIHGRFVQVPRILFTYTGRRAWNSVHQDARSFLGVNRKPWHYQPFVMLFLHHCSRLARAPISFRLKVRLWIVLARHQAGQVALKTLLKLAGLLCPEGKKEKLGRAIYWRWMRNPNLEVASSDGFFFERAIKPQLRWWK